MGLFDQTSTVASGDGGRGGDGSGKKLLSERLRNMRFMRGAQGAETKSREAKEEREKRELEQQMHWTAEVPDSLREAKAGGGGGIERGGEEDNETMVRKPVVIIEDGNAWDGPVVARRSFGKFNPAVEKRNRAALGIEDKEKEKANDEEMKETPGKEEDQAVTVKDEDELEQHRHQPTSYQNMKQSSKNQQHYQRGSFAKRMMPPSSLAKKRSFSKSVNSGNMQSQHLTVSPASAPGSASFNSSRKRSRRGSYRHAGKSAPTR